MFKKILLLLLLNIFLFANSEKYNLYGLIELPSTTYHSDNLIGLELYSADDINFTSTIREINATSIDSKNSIYSYNFENLENGEYYIVLPIKDNDGLKNLNESGIYVKKFNLITGNKRNDGTYRVYYSDFSENINYIHFPYGWDIKRVEKYNCREEYQNIPIMQIFYDNLPYSNTEEKLVTVCDTKNKYINKIVPIEINGNNTNINFKLFEAKEINITLNLDDSNLTNIDINKLEFNLETYLNRWIDIDENGKSYDISGLEYKSEYDELTGEFLNYYLINEEYIPIYTTSTYSGIRDLKDINISNGINVEYLYPNDGNEYSVHYGLEFDNLRRNDYYYFASIFLYFNTKDDLSNIELNETLLQVDVNVSDISNYEEILLFTDFNYFDYIDYSNSLYFRDEDINYSNLNISIPILKKNNYSIFIENHQDANIKIQECDYYTNNTFLNTISNIKNYFIYYDNKLMFEPMYPEDYLIDINSNFNLILPEINITQEKTSINTTSLNFSTNMGKSETKTITIQNNNKYPFDSMVFIDFENSKEFVNYNYLNKNTIFGTGEFTLSSTYCYMEVNESCEIKVTYTPLDNEINEASIIIRDSRLSANYLSTSTDKVITLIGNGVDENIENVELNIPKGWSLLSIPIDSEISLNELNSNNIWVYQNGWIKNPQKIEPQEGFWIYSNSDRVVKLRGNEYETNLRVQNNNWYLKGSGKELIDIDYWSNYKEIWLYNNLTKEWIYNPNEIKRGEGFWFKVNYPLLPSLDR